MFPLVFMLRKSIPVLVFDIYLFIHIFLLLV